MNRWTPCKRRVFIRRLFKLGFDGPFAGSRHRFMVYNNHRLTIPSNSEFPVPQLTMMIREVEDILGGQINLSDWNQL